MTGLGKEASKVGSAAFGNCKDLGRGIWGKICQTEKIQKLEAMNTAVKILVVAIPAIIEIIRISTKR